MAVGGEEPSSSGGGENVGASGVLPPHEHTPQVDGATPLASSGRGRGSAARFRRDIEGMRAIAVLLVVLFHAGFGWVSGGYVGVDVFFVISGFLITQLLVAELDRSGRISLSGFYLRRMRRLLPAFSLVIAATLVAMRIVAPPLATIAAAGDAAWSSIYLANVRFMMVELDYLAAGQHLSPLLHMWSLAVEEQFYVVWPAVIMLVALVARAHNPRVLPAVAILITIGSAVLSVFMTQSDPVVAYYSPFTRACELGIGCVVALTTTTLCRVPARVASMLSFTGLAAIVISACTYSLQTPFPGTAVLLPTVGAGLVLAFTRPATLVERVLAVRPMQVIGLLSYSIYLWHWPLLVLARTSLGHEPGALQAASLVLASIVLAWGTYHVVENPVRRSTWIQSRRRRGLTLGVMLTIGPALLSVAVERSVSVEATGARQQLRALSTASDDSIARLLREEQLELRRSLGIRMVPRNLTPAIDRAGADRPVLYNDGCHRGRVDAARVNQDCSYGDTESSVKLVLFGDSHAAHWFPALEQMSRARSLHLLSLTRSNCSPLWVDRYAGQHVVDSGCNRWRSNVVAEIGRIQPEVVVLSWSWLACADRVGECARGLGEMLRNVHELAPDTRLVVMRDTPLAPESVPTCLSAHLDDVPDCTIKETSARQSKELAREVERAANAAGARFIDPVPWLCVDGSCPVIVGNVLVYRDAHHLTVRFARQLTPLLEASLMPAIRQSS